MLLLNCLQLKNIFLCQRGLFWVTQSSCGLFSVDYLKEKVNKTCRAGGSCLWRWHLRGSDGILESMKLTPVMSHTCRLAGSLPGQYPLNLPQPPNRNTPVSSPILNHSWLSQPSLELSDQSLWKEWDSGNQEGEDLLGKEGDPAPGPGHCWSISHSSLPGASIVTPLKAFSKQSFSVETATSPSGSPNLQSPVEAFVL